MNTIYLYGAFAGNRGDVLMHMAARNALTRHGIHVTEDEATADAIINCCGYWCGDPWGELWSRKMRERVMQWKEAGKKLIFLPQTFGPFSDAHIAEEIQIMVHHAALVCPRDAVSLQLLTEVCGEQAIIQQFPDYTIDIEPIASDVFQPTADSIAVIPNLRMMDKSDPRTSAQYLPFLGQAIALLRDAGANPFLLIHEEKDSFFADALRQEYDDLPVVIEPDAQKTKWIIGQSKAAISSRYHGILNALYQDIPVLATGWCHKFPALMDEWGCADRLIDLQAIDDDLSIHIHQLLDGETWKSAAPIRSITRENYRKQTNRLWETAAQILV